MQYVFHRFHIARGFSFELHWVKKSISNFCRKYQKFTKILQVWKKLHFCCLEMQYVLHRFHIARGFSFELYRVMKSISNFCGKYQKFIKILQVWIFLLFSTAPATTIHFFILRVYIAPQACLWNSQSFIEAYEYGKRSPC